MSAESGEHWYRQADGSPCYSVIGKNGRERAVWKTDAEQLGLVKSVTSHLAIIAKPALYDYFVKEGAKHALENPLQAGEEMEDYLKRICSGSKLHAKAAAEEGGRIHDAIEKSFKGQAYDGKYQLHVAAAHAEIERLYPGVTDWIAEASFAHPLGFGGKVDLHSPSTGIVHDWKTKSGDFSDGKRLHYDQNYQLAAYAVGLRLTGGKDELAFVACGNSFVSRTHPGAIQSHVWSEDEIAKGWRVFLKALELSQEISEYSGRY